MCRTQPTRVGVAAQLLPVSAARVLPTIRRVRRHRKPRARGRGFAHPKRPRCAAGAVCGATRPHAGYYASLSVGHEWATRQMENDAA